MKSLRAHLVGLSRPAKQLVAAGTDAVGFGVSVTGVAWLLSELDLAAQQLTLICLSTVAIALPLAWSQGLYRSVVRFMGMDLFTAGVKTAFGSAITGAALLFLMGVDGAPLRWVVAYWGTAFIYICSSRYLARVFLTHHKLQSPRERVIIYGAGAAGASLQISLAGSDEWLPVAMVDDNPSLCGKTVKGLTVHSPALIEALIRDTQATKVLLAMPSASRRKRRQVLERLSEFPVHVQTIPEIKDLVSGKAQVHDIMDVKVRDLLGRDTVPPNSELMGASITGKRVMVTGAGGSIGAELCRQILTLNPVRLVIFDFSEVALYNLEKELIKAVRDLGSNCKIIALLGSVYREIRVRDAMQTFEIQTTYHAAAYKHVPIVEQNLFEGIHNNVFGTLRTVRAAIESGVENFVLISTDKAVKPSSVMGATKRFAELILQAYNNAGSRTRLSMVRFGNVLESSGSVVPLFREQIRNGGPVTVTHRDIVRYFMTTHEAAQLVIQTAALARGGDVFVLDMGKPVRIQDLACRMINLMGMTVRDKGNPDGDIEIKYVGLRPAEKLYEELLIGSNVSGTEHPRIMRADEDCLPLAVLLGFIGELEKAAEVLDHERARNILLKVVKEYRPDNGIDDLVWMNKNRPKESAGTVVDIRAKA